ncbi:MAG: RNA polymerase sigma factor [Bacteroides sp.]|nr:RNA polymerase sigma factor [Alistipes timonensis]MCM1311085.1 RNA polymerase sigma factor [Bacteroides sp.]MCM1405694.1 RNA polymerase sigma factor [[Clostridium] fimetarium]
MKKDVLTTSFLDIRGKLHRMAMRLLQNDEDARDAVQDTFEKLWSKDEIESNAEARNKLTRVLRNTCIDRLRTTHTVPLESVETEFDRGYETPTEDMERYERLIVNGLTETQTRIYNLITHDCLEYEEVAKQLNMSVEAVRMNMSRARKRIRENIKKIDR